MTKTIQEKERFIQLRARGLSFDKIAEELQVSKPTLLKWSGEFYEEIKEAEFQEFDSLLNEYQVHRNNRFKQNCKLLNACYEELENKLEKKDLSKLSVPELQKLVSILEEKLDKESANSEIQVQVPSDYSFAYKEFLRL
jgi:predicted RND superfamily exporter protein